MSTIERPAASDGDERPDEVNTREESPSVVAPAEGDAGTVTTEDTPGIRTTVPQNAPAADAPEGGVQPAETGAARDPEPDPGDGDDEPESGLGETDDESTED